MRKYIISGAIGAMFACLLLVVVVKSSDQAARFFGEPRDSSLQTRELAKDPEFIAALQSKLQPTPHTTTLKGDKGDTGDSGQVGAQGAAGPQGAAGTQGPAGPAGPAGQDGQDGQDGADGTSYNISGQGLEVTSNTLGLELDGSTLSASANGLRVNSTFSDQWDLSYSWGDHGTAGYAELTGQAGGQTLIGGTATNDTLVLQSTSASGTTATNAAIQFKVGDAGATTALSILNNGNIGIGTTASYGKVNLNGTMVTTSEGDIFSQRDSSSNATYPVFARYYDTSSSDFDGGTFLFGNGANAWVGLEKPGGSDLTRLRVRATNSSFSGNVGITTNGSNHIVPFQFVQVTGLGDNPTLTTFGGTSYPVSDWNPAVVGFASGGSCGTGWAGGTLNGFHYWWENNGGNWQLRIDMSGPNDGCNRVQVMFVRKEFSNRSGYGF